METKSTKDLLMKILFITGIFVLVVVLAFTLIRVIPLMFSSMANVGGIFQAEEGNPMGIAVNKSTVNSGETSNITWGFEPTETGVYEIEYTCADELKIEIGTTEGTRAINCNTIYHLSPTSRSVSILPTLSKDNSLVDTNLKIRYIARDGDIVISDSVKLTIVKRSQADLAGSGTIIETEIIQSAPVQTTPSQDDTSTTTTGQTTQTSVAQPVGLADLRIYDVYTVDDVTIIFSVSNIGARATGIWYFNYAMPDGDVQRSPNQASMLPGQAIRYTLRLQDVPRGTVAIALDPQNLIREVSIINNIAAIEIRGDGGRNDGGWVDSNRRADLEISNLEVGRITGSRFISTTDIYTYETAAIRFIVKNIGGQNTGTWRFNISNLPYFDQNIFESQRQTSLRPGESREIIVELGRPDAGSYNIRVDLDPNNDIREESTRNNYESRRLRVIR